MSHHLAALSNDLLLKYFDTTNSHISRIPEFPQRFTCAPFIKYGPAQVQAQTKKINTTRQASINEPNHTLMRDKSNSSIQMAQKPPPDFKEHKVKSNTEQYYLPKIKDGLPTTVKNLSFLRNQNSFKKTKNKDSPLKDEQNFISVRRSLETSQEDMLAIEYPSQIN